MVLLKYNGFVEINYPFVLVKPSCLVYLTYTYLYII